MHSENLFKEFGDAYIKALDYLNSEKIELAKTQYLKMFELHSRLDRLGIKNLSEISNKNLREIFSKIKNEL